MNKRTQIHKNTRSGFTLTEVLCTVLLVAIASIALVSGVSVANRQFQTAIRLSQAQQLSTTLETLLSNELKYTNKIIVEDGQVKKFYSVTYAVSSDLTELVILNGNQNEVIQNNIKYGELALGDGTQYNRLLSHANYSNELGVKIESLTYDEKNKVFHVTMNIGTDSLGSLVEETFSVRALNEVTS